MTVYYIFVDYEFHGITTDENSILFKLAMWNKYARIYSVKLEA